MNYVDLAVGITSLIEMTASRLPIETFLEAPQFTNVIDVPLNPLLFRLLRIGKLFRAIRMVHMTNVLASLHLLVTLGPSERGKSRFWGSHLESLTEEVPHRQLQHALLELLLPDLKINCYTHTT